MSWCSARTPPWQSPFSCKGIPTPGVSLLITQQSSMAMTLPSGDTFLLVTTPLGCPFMDRIRTSVSLRAVSLGA